MKNNLRKTTKKSLAVVSAIVGMSVLFAACSSTDDNRVSGGVSEDAGFVADVAGVAQKGPFVKGSAVTVRGIDCKTLEFTDQVFEGTIKSDKGDFALDSIALDSSCAVIEVTGKYLNEVTGKKTMGELTLRALTDLKNRENVNVNLLTNLAYERVMYLVKQKNKTLAKAKTQAESEVLAAFDIKDEINEFENLNIFESGDGNAALLAVSVMMQGDADDAALAMRLEKFAEDIAKDGEWNDSKAKTEIAEWTAAAVESGKLDSIRANVESVNDGEKVAEFEKYIPVVVPDAEEDVSSSSEGSSSSAEQDSLEETVSSSSSVSLLSSSSMLLTDSLLSSSAASSSSAIPDTLRSSSSKVESSSSVHVADSLSSSSVVPVDTMARDTVARDTMTRDTSARDTSVRDTGSVKPDTSTAKDTACIDTEFPYELTYLIGNGYETLSATCERDSSVVTWRSRHEIHELEVSAPGTYVFSMDYEQEVNDSLASFKSAWLDDGSGYVARRPTNADRNTLVRDVYGYSYTDSGIDASLDQIDNVTSYYYFRMDLKNVSYVVYVYSVPEVLVSASGSRTIRYGFVVDLSAIYPTR
ncbi:MAG: hypothetical protein IKT05_08350 [Fibrobacter sp.]|nr:hypothetical protein [Fibrobacter sp.]